MVKCIKAGLKFHYMAFQNQYRYSNGSEFEDHFNHIEEYLSHIDILFDAEADKAFNKDDHDGGAWHLTVSTGQINSF